MPGPVKTQAVVLRSIRFGEADRIVHLYTPHRGRLGAIAKGARRRGPAASRRPGLARDAAFELTPELLAR